MSLGYVGWNKWNGFGTESAIVSPGMGPLERLWNGAYPEASTVARVGKSPEDEKGRTAGCGAIGAVHGASMGRLVQFDSGSGSWVNSQPNHIPCSASGAYLLQHAFLAQVLQIPGRGISGNAREFPILSSRQLPSYSNGQNRLDLSRIQSQLHQRFLSQRGSPQRRGLLLITGGVLVGLVGSFAATRLLSGFLFGVTPTDPATFVAVSLLLGAIAILASYIPARRATKVDPLVALRAE